ncbi:MAG: hypothetical protein EBV89_08150, partial [Betaproteobacteria bacterium]|nr:hypothetical protein [Betaproteobacteria bacterium]
MNLADQAAHVLLGLYASGKASPVEVTREILQRIERLNPALNAYCLVDEDGAILKLVEEERRAWHAGRGVWQGETDCNGASIGIEIVNPGHEFGYRDFPEAQVASVIELVADIRSRWT